MVRFRSSTVERSIRVIANISIKYLRLILDISNFSMRQIRAGVKGVGKFSLADEID